MPTTLVTEPAIEPVTLEEAKAHLRVDADITDDDILIASLITAARADCENTLKRSLMTQTWELVLDCFASEIALSMPPVQSVTSVTYVDVNGATQTLAPSSYVLDKDSEPARLVAAAGVSWPALGTGINRVRIRYVAGYATIQKVPEPIKLWLKMRIGTAYDTRRQFGAVERSAMLELPHIDGLLDRYRIVRVF